MILAVISHPVCSRHDMGPGHPEQPARLRAILDRLAASDLDAAIEYREARPATREQLESCHDAVHVERIFSRAPEDGLVWLDGDTAMNAHSLEASLRAAGAAAEAVDRVMAGEVAAAFCAVRPPGHHAERNRAMGFCLFNNAAIAARHAIDEHGLERVAIVDFDVHHGNGTEDIVSGDERILFCSTFQHPFYPFSGAGGSAANVVNSPLPAGSGSDLFRETVERDWLGRLESFAPQLILVSAGFDAHRSDPLGGLQLVEEDYAWVTRRLCEQADRSAAGRIVSSLEGGYDLHALARSVEAHLGALIARD